MEAHVLDGVVEVVVEDSEEALHGLDGSGEVEIETQSHQNLGLEVDEGLLADIPFFFVSKEIYHSGEAWGDRLLELGRHEDANGGQVYHLRFGEVGGSYHVDVSVHDVGCDKQGFILVLLLGMEVKYFLDSVRAVISGNLLVRWVTLLKADSFDYSLAD